MTLHPRHSQVVNAHLSINKAITKEVERNDITYAELVSILAEVLARWTKSQIREERGGEEAL